MTRSISTRTIQCLLAATLLSLTAGCGTSVSLPFVGHKSSKPTSTVPRQVAVRATSGKAKAGHIGSGRALGVRGSTHHSVLRVYSMHLVPVMARSTVVFDHAAAGIAAVKSADGLDPTCSSFGNKVLLQQSLLEGVPHPLPWYTGTGRLHHAVAGIYHNMLGAIQACQTAAGSGDTTAQATALSDVRQAAAALHRETNYVRWLATHHS